MVFPERRVREAERVLGILVHVRKVPFVGVHAGQRCQRIAERQRRERGIQTAIGLRAHAVRAHPVLVLEVARE